MFVSFSILRNELPLVVQSHDRPKIEGYVVSPALNKASISARTRTCPEAYNAVVVKLGLLNSEHADSTRLHQCFARAQALGKAIQSPPGQSIADSQRPLCGGSGNND